MAAAGGISPAIRAALAGAPDLPVQVEVRDQQELRQALDAGARNVLLDNMSLADLHAATELARGRAQTEASGGVTLETVRDVGRTGVDFVRVGAVTHSAPALDLSMLIDQVS